MITSDDNKHRPLKDTLKVLPKVKAGDDFERRLFNRLRDVESEKHRSPSFKKLIYKNKRFAFFGFLRPSLIPAIALSVVLLIVIVYYINIELIQKTQVSPEISQNKQVSPQLNLETDRNKDTEKLISKTETSLRENTTSNEKSRLQPGPPTGVFDDFDKTPSLSSPEKKDEKSDETISVPRLEDKRSGELKNGEIETGETKLEEKKEAPVMRKKSDELHYRDTEKEKGEDDKVNQSIDGKSVNAPAESQQDVSKKSDSVKAKIRGNKKSTKDTLYNDTIKNPPVQKSEQEDSSKVFQK
jgi:hypothetical protein